MDTRTFPSKIDTWLAAVMAAAGLGCIVAVAAVFTSTALGAAWIALLTVLVGIGLPMWVMLTTHYTFRDRELIVRSGPFRWHIRCAEISRVLPTRNPLSSPALSLDRLRIEYGDSRALMVSPRDKEGFLRELEARRGR